MKLIKLTIGKSVFHIPPSTKTKHLITTKIRFLMYEKSGLFSIITEDVKNKAFNSLYSNLYGKFSIIQVAVADWLTLA